MESIFIKVPLSKRLPPLGMFVSVVDSAGEILIYRRISSTQSLYDSFYAREYDRQLGNESWAWNMRDMRGNNTPNDNLPMVYWLEEVPLEKLEHIKEIYNFLAADVPC